MIGSFSGVKGLLQSLLFPQFLQFILVDIAQGAAIGEEYEIYDEIAEAFDGNATVDSEMTSDEWGDFRCV